MSSGVYLRTEEWRLIHSLASKGRHYSPNTEFHKGHTPWGKGLTKETSETIKNRGLEHSRRMRGRISPKRGMSFPEYGGSNHWNWQGGITPDTNVRVNSTNWRWVRREVYERDDYTCQICGKRGGRLMAHHIIPYRLSQDDSMRNLITVCPHCHYLEDLKFNRGLSGMENV